MGVPPMSRRAVPALLVFSLKPLVKKKRRPPAMLGASKEEATTKATGETPVGLTGKMPVPLVLPSLLKKAADPLVPLP